MTDWFVVQSVGSTFPHDWSLMAGWIKSNSQELRMQGISWAIIIPMEESAQFVLFVRWWKATDIATNTRTLWTSISLLVYWVWNVLLWLSTVSRIFVISLDTRWKWHERGQRPFVVSTILFKSQQVLPLANSASVSVGRAHVCDDNIVQKCRLWTDNY